MCFLIHSLSRTHGNKIFLLLMITKNQHLAVLAIIQSQKADGFGIGGGFYLRSAFVSLPA